MQIPDGWASRHVTLNNCRHHYVIGKQTDRPTLIVAHGFTDNWQCLAPLAAPFDDAYNVVLYDARGHGLSEATGGGYDAETMADDLAALCGYLGVEHPVFYGHSLGADSALRVACRSNVSPRALVLEEHPAQLFTVLGDDHLQEKRQELKAWGTATHEELRLAFEKRGEVFADALATARKQVRPSVIGVTRRGFRPIADTASSPPCPTLLLRPDPDVAPYTDAARDWSGGGAVRHAVDGAGHTVFRDAPDTCRSFIESFFEENGLPT
ncbi:alpha/beta fold hydrolase [Halocalculus aciditolerans]|nr:alpha/beta hydrolase [Halocalculus aciditolerans]